MSVPVIMYTTAVCPYCVMAERLLQSRGVDSIEKIRIDADPQQRADRQGKLAPLLRGE